MKCCASVIIPAHNEEQVIGRLLAQLVDDVAPLEIIVVCNGCTDRTASTVHAFGGAVRVIEVSEPSKRHAMRVGNEAANWYPRVFVDADIEISARSVRRLADTLANGEVLAAAPARVIPMDGVQWLVRWYYDVWEQLPQTRSGLFGRGVIALSEAGNARVSVLPAMMGDDLVASEAFAPRERAVVADAHVVVHPPRTIADHYRRRVRAVTGNAQADALGARGRGAVTSPISLLRVARAHPRLLVKLPVFVGFAVASRIGAYGRIRSGDDRTWLRDESSRRDRGTER